MKIVPWEKELIGKRVLASQDGKTFFPGTLKKVIDMFAPYGVQVDSLNNVRYFAGIIKEESK